jgi:hypothetical protein
MESMAAGRAKLWTFSVRMLPYTPASTSTKKITNRVGAVTERQALRHVVSTRGQNRQSLAAEGQLMLFKNINIDGLNIFYREAGKETRRSLSSCTVFRLHHTSIAMALLNFEWVTRHPPRRWGRAHGLERQPIDPPVAILAGDA